MAMRAIGSSWRMVSSNSGVEKRSWKNGLAITPGETPLTRMFAPRQFLGQAARRVREERLGARVQQEPGPPPLRAAIELVLMMLRGQPPSCA